MTTPYNVANEGDLNLAIKAIYTGSVLDAPGAAFTIDFTAGKTIDLTSALEAINLKNGDTLTIDGNNDTIDGGGTQRGFFVYSGTVTIDDLTIQHTAAVGGAGAGGGGGGAGLGGGLFVANDVADGAASAGNVTLNNVTFKNDTATGGAGGGFDSGPAGGGGGGMGGAAGAFSFGLSYGGGGGGGGLGVGASGGSGGDTADGAGIGQAGIVFGAAGGAAGGNGGEPGGSSGGGGGGGGEGYGGGGGIGGKVGNDRNSNGSGGSLGSGGAGGYGGGGGGAGFNLGARGGAGGFGGGGGAAEWVDSVADTTGGEGGFGGGGGAGDGESAGSVFGGGSGGSEGAGGGGGGLGAGGDIFVQQGASLTINSGTLSGGAANGGAGGQGGGTGGQGYGTGIFLQGNQSMTFSPKAGQTLTIDDVITDQTGSADIEGEQGAGSLIINGKGTVDLNAANTYAGDTTIDSGTLLLGNDQGASQGVIDLAKAGATLALQAGVSPDGYMDFAPSTDLDLLGVAADSAYYTVAGSSLLVVSDQGQIIKEMFVSADDANMVFGVVALAAGAGTQIEALSSTATVTQFLAKEALYSSVVSGLTLTGSASLISAHLGAFTSGGIAAITISDNAAIKLSLADLTNDATVLSKLTNADASPYKLAIADTAANIGAALDSLNGNTHIASITISNNRPIAISVAQLTADKVAFGKLVDVNAAPVTFAISDTGANVQAALKALSNAGAKIASITLTSGAVTVTASTYKSYKTTLDKIGGGFAVSDTAANIEANLANLAADANIKSINVKSGGPLTVSAADFVSDQTTLDEIAPGFAVADTAANIQAKLAKLAADKHLLSITIKSGGPLKETVATFAADRTALDKVSGGFTIADTTANVKAKLADLAKDSHIHSIALTGGGALTENAATFVADKTTLDKVSAGFDIADTGAKLGAVLAALNADAKVHAITISDNGPVVTTVANFTNDSKAIAELANANASQVRFAIKDDGSNVQPALKTLSQAGDRITSITLTGGEVDVSIATYKTYKSTLDKIASGVAIRDTLKNTQSELADLASDAHISSITVSGGYSLSENVATFLAEKTTLNKLVYGFEIDDTAARIQAELVPLFADEEAVAIYTTGVTPLKVTAATFIADFFGFAKMGSFFDIADSAANIQAKLNDLSEDFVNHPEIRIESIVVTSGGPLTESVRNFLEDQPALKKVVGGVVVADTTTEIQGSFSDLKKFTADVKSMEFTGSGTPVLTVRAADVNGDSKLLAKITSGYVLNVVDTNGSTTSTGHGDDLTIADVGGKVTMTGGGSDETFAFATGFGTATVTDFHNHLTGAQHDVISLQKSEFNYLKAGMSESQDLAAVLSHASASGGDVTIKDTAATPDALTIVGVTKTVLTANAGDFAFV